jgi:hypothetical protein
MDSQMPKMKRIIMSVSSNRGYGFFYLTQSTRRKYMKKLLGVFLGLSMICLLSGLATAEEPSRGDQPSKEQMHAKREAMMKEHQAKRQKMEGVHQQMEKLRQQMQEEMAKMRQIREQMKALREQAGMGGGEEGRGSTQGGMKME